MEKKVHDIAGAWMVFLFTVALCTFHVQAQCGVDGNVTLTTYPNTYFPGVTPVLNPGATSIDIGAATGITPISPGDLLLIIQMQGSEIDSSNSTAYGDGMPGGVAAGFLNNTMFLAGNMEYITAVNAIGLGGGTLTITTPLAFTYRTQNASKTRGQYRYQVIRVPRFNDVILGATISPPAWNGDVGGVLAFLSAGSFHFNGFMLSADGCGFRGGASRQLFGTGYSAVDYLTYSTLACNGSKGEGISGLPRYIFDGMVIDNGIEGIPGGSYGMGAPGNGGGGGTDANIFANDENTGGGGGSNGGAGGKGGNSWRSNQPFGGEGGVSLMSYVGANRIFMGGGGGAGSNNNFSSSHGGKGGGIIILDLNQIISAGTIRANGTGGGTVANDGGGGGGAGGSVMLRGITGMAGVTVIANGGDGGDAWITQAPGSPFPGTRHGPGGGGGGGVILTNAPINPASTAAPGGSGHTTTLLDPYGSSGGAGGMMNSSLLYTPTPCVLADVRIGLTAERTSASDVHLQWNIIGEASGICIVERAGADWTISGVYTAPSTPTGMLWDDKEASQPVLFYRIRLIDVTGSSYYSPWVEINGDAADRFLLYPNPGKGIFTISGLNPEDQIAVFDAAGRQCHINRLDTYQFELNNIVSGIYGIRITRDGICRTLWYTVQ